MAHYPPTPRHLTRAEYDRLITLGVFQPGAPLELLGGHLMVAEPQGTLQVTPLAAPGASIAVARLLP